MWFSIFLLNPFVSRVKRRMDMRIVRFWRSTVDVEMWRLSGLPLITSLTVPVIFAGL